MKTIPRLLLAALILSSAQGAFPVSESGWCGDSPRMEKTGCGLASYLRSAEAYWKADEEAFLNTGSPEHAKQREERLASLRKAAGRLASDALDPDGKKKEALLRDISRLSRGDPAEWRKMLELLEALYERRRSLDETTAGAVRRLLAGDGFDIRAMMKEYAELEHSLSLGPKTRGGMVRLPGTRSGMERMYRLLRRMETIEQLLLHRVELEAERGDRESATLRLFETVAPGSALIDRLRAASARHGGITSTHGTSKTTSCCR